MSKKTAWDWWDEGEHFFDQRKYSEAIECFDEAIKLDSKCQSIWSSGCSHSHTLRNEAMKRREEAKERILQKIFLLEEERKRKEEEEERKKEEEERERKEEEERKRKEEEERKRKEEEERKRKEDWINKGNELDNLGKYNEAIECFDESLQIDPNYNEAKISKERTISLQESNYIFYFNENTFSGIKSIHFDICEKQNFIKPFYCTIILSSFLILLLIFLIFFLYIWQKSKNKTTTPIYKETRKSSSELNDTQKKLLEPISGLNNNNDNDNDNQIDNNSNRKIIFVSPSEVELTNIKIGEGSFGDVYKAIYVGKEIVVKQLKDRKNEKSFFEEAELALGVPHPHIIQCYGYTQMNGFLFLLFEYATLGSLDKYLQENKPFFNKLLELSIQLTSAIVFLHSRNIIHRDLAADNVLVSATLEGPMIKLSDFGLSRASTRYVITGVRGKNIFSAPEVLRDMDCYASPASDIYSLGVVLWQIFSYGIKPENEAKDLKQPSACTPELFSIMKDCWNENTSERPEAKTLLDKLKQIQQTTKK